MTDISVIVPIYNVEKYLKECIEGILSQTYERFELILINDGSPDNCGQICEEYKKRDSRIKVIHQENQGTGRARNNGIEAAVGKYIYFCDPDDYLEPTLLANNFDLAEKYMVNMIIFGHYNVIYKDTKCRIIKELSSESKFLESKDEFRDEFGTLFSKEIMYTLWNKLYKRDFLVKNNCFFLNQKVGEDSIFNYKVYENLDRVYVNEKKYYYYVNSRNESATNLFRKDKFEIRYKETFQFEKLLELWGKQEKYKYLIINDWIITLLVGINNLFNENSPYKDREKKTQIKEITHAPKINQILHETKIGMFRNPLDFIQFFLLKKNFINFAFYLFKIKLFIKGVVNLKCSKRVNKHEILKLL